MKFLYRLVSRACTYTVLFTLTAILFTASSEVGAGYLSAEQFLLIILFSAILTAAGELSWLELSRGLYRTLHYLTVTASFLTLAVSSGKITGGGRILVAATLFTVVYAVATLVKWWLVRRAERTNGRQTRKI